MKWKGQWNNIEFTRFLLAKLFTLDYGDNAAAIN